MSTRIFDAPGRIGKPWKFPFALSLSKGRSSSRRQGRTALRQAQRERGWLLTSLLLAGCGEQPANDIFPASSPEAANAIVAARAEEPKIPCAAPGAADLTPVCTIDTTETPTGTILTLRHPDGAFHRLQITRDGRGVIAADGAEPASVTPLGPDSIEVQLGGARYRLPATVRADTAK